MSENILNKIQRPERYKDEVTSRTIEESLSWDENMIMEDALAERNTLKRQKDNEKFLKNINLKNGIKTKQPKKRHKLINKLFSNISSIDINIDDKVIEKMKAIPADERLIAKNQDIKQAIAKSIANNWGVKSNKDKSFFAKDLPTKREALRKLAMQSELEEILDQFTNDAVVYDGKLNYFMGVEIDHSVFPNDFKKSYIKTIENTAESYFPQFYRMLKWKTNAWDDFKRFLIEGVLSFEMVYDDIEKPKKIIAIIPIDPATLSEDYQNGKKYWYQFKGIRGKERKLLDAQIIYIQFQENTTNRQSYLERLIKDYNVYRIIEQAQIIWTVTNASFKTKFTIPVNGMPDFMAEQTLSASMNRYRENIKFDSESGELSINGKTNLPFNQEYWMPDSEYGTPDIETLGGDGPSLIDDEQLEYFRNKLYTTSKIPVGRFRKGDSGEWFGTDATSYMREEMNYGRYVNRLRNTFAQIMIKPIQMQIALDMPEIQTELWLLDSVGVTWNSYNKFEELMEMELQQKSVEFISDMKDSLVDEDDEGKEIKYFSNEFLVERYLKLSSTDIKRNKELKKQESKELEELMILRKKLENTDNNEDY